MKQHHWLIIAHIYLAAAYLSDEPGVDLVVLGLGLISFVVWLITNSLSSKNQREGRCVMCGHKGE